MLTKEEFETYCKKNNLRYEFPYLKLSVFYDYLDKKFDEYIFITCCAYGYLETLKWLKTLKKNNVNKQFSKSVYYCCLNNNIEILEWLKKTFNYKISLKIFIDICKNISFDFAEKIFPITKKFYSYEFIVRSGNYNILKFIIEKYVNLENGKEKIENIISIFFSYYLFNNENEFRPDKKKVLEKMNEISNLYNIAIESNCKLNVTNILKQIIQKMHQWHFYRKETEHKKNLIKWFIDKNINIREDDDFIFKHAPLGYAKILCKYCSDYMITIDKYGREIGKVKDIFDGFENNNCLMKVIKRLGCKII